MKATKYDDIDWGICQSTLLNLQQRIAIACLDDNKRGIQELVNTLTSSFAARAMAVRKVTSSPGKRTPGVDGETWDDSDIKFEAIERLKNLKNYKAKPVRRVYIKKPQGGLRPLGIPTLFDRAV
jgi:RNA-directed DNA polymerase